MSGDYSRFTFDPARNYATVRMQQGRISLDSDWNEQGDLIDRRMRAAMLDAFGRLHIASPGAFAISADASGLSIGRGRIYVDGLVAENHGAGRRGFDPVLAEVYGEAPAPYAQQPYFPGPPALPNAGGPYLVYLDVWQREVTAVENPALVDVALGGPDTASRLQTVWQVKLLSDAHASAANPLQTMPQFVPCVGWLSAQAAGGYLGVENGLYRIEVHDGGPFGIATFKWSHDNGASAARVRQNGASELLLDEFVRFSVAAGDWIEITDDQRELHGLPGEMRRVRQANSKAIGLARPLQGPLGANARLRRWEQRGKVLDQTGAVIADLDDANSTGTIPVQAKRWIVLENGISIAFALASAGGVFRSGDYWATPARIADGSIAPLCDAPPFGIHHHYAELALFTPPHRVIDRRSRA